MHTQGKSGWQYLRTPKVWPCLGRLHGGSRKGVDDEQQWLMRWGSTLLSQPASLPPPIKILHQKYLLASGIWILLLSSLNPPLSFRSIVFIAWISRALLSTYLTRSLLCCCAVVLLLLRPLYLGLQLSNLDLFFWSLDIPSHHTRPLFPFHQSRRAREPPTMSFPPRGTSPHSPHSGNSSHSPQASEASMYGPREVSDKQPRMKNKRKK